MDKTEIYRLLYDKEYQKEQIEQRRKAIEEYEEKFLKFQNLHKIDIKNNRADEIFKSNIGHYIKAEVLTNELGVKMKVFEGKLIQIFCNTFIIIKEVNNCIEMFRYEDLINLQVIK